LIKFFFHSTDELRESKNTVSELTRRLHEYELEIRRLENEREELTAAYKEAEAVRFFFVVVKQGILIKTKFFFRDVKQKRSVHSHWHLNTDNSVTTLNAAFKSRKKKLKQFGKLIKIVFLYFKFGKN
jgi:hypothetical protein